MQGSISTLWFATHSITGSPIPPKAFGANITLKTPQPYFSRRLSCLSITLGILLRDFINSKIAVAFSAAGLSEGVTGKAVTLKFCSTKSDTCPSMVGCMMFTDEAGSVSLSASFCLPLQYSSFCFIESKTPSPLICRTALS